MTGTISVVVTKETYQGVLTDVAKFNVVMSDQMAAWGAYISAATDHNLGLSGHGGNYPYYVGEFHGVGNGTSVWPLLSTDHYMVELASYGVVEDTAVFDITGCQGIWQCEQPLNGIENNGCGQRRTNPACNPQNKFSCDDGCVAGTHLVGYGTQAECQAACNAPPLTKYSCLNGVCVIDVNGQYSSLAACQIACNPPGTKYSCKNGQCVADVNGTYTTLVECQKACGLTGIPIEVIIAIVLVAVYFLLMRKK